MTNTESKQIAPEKLSLKKRLKDSWMLLLLLAPVIIYFTIFNYIPLYGLQIAFKKYRIAAGITKSQWIGLDHFAKFFRSSLAVSSLWNTVALSFSLLLFSIPVPIILALSLNMIRNKRTKQFVQTATYLPYFISVMVVIGIMNQMLSPVSGVVNQFIELLGGGKGLLHGQRELVPAPLHHQRHLAEFGLCHHYLSGRPLLG